MQIGGVGPLRASDRESGVSTRVAAAPSENSIFCPRDGGLSMRQTNKHLPPSACSTPSVGAYTIGDPTPQACELKTFSRHIEHLE